MPYNTKSLTKLAFCFFCVGLFAICCACSVVGTGSLAGGCLFGLVPARPATPYQAARSPNRAAPQSTPLHGSAVRCRTSLCVPMRLVSAGPPRHGEMAAMVAAMMAASKDIMTGTRARVRKRPGAHHSALRLGPRSPTPPRPNPPEAAERHVM